MRAKMSDSSKRRTKDIDADQMTGASAFQWGLLAEQEARAILAETEPEDKKGCTYNIYAAIPRHLRHATMVAYDPAHGALAEALVAFVKVVRQ